MMTDPIQSILPLRILVLDDEATIRTTLTVCLQTAGHQVVAFGSGQPALEAAEKQPFDLLFLDLRLGIENGLDYIPQFLQRSSWLKIIVITAYASIETAVEAMRLGALDYLPKPFTPEHVEMLAAKVADAKATTSRLRELTDRLDSNVPPVKLTSSNSLFRNAVEMAKIFAPSKATILIQGESGTGKRMLARAIHEWSPRCKGPFEICTAHERDEHALGSELFGVSSTEQGGQIKHSRLEYCEGGTLYLDDLCALPPRLQLKLLEFIQAGTFEREEGFDKISADVRLIVGTTKPIAPLVEAGLFRQDLYYTLSSKAIELPALRERMEDFYSLTMLFVAFYSRQNGASITNLSKDAMNYLSSYSWPGNIHELRNVIERAVLLCCSDIKKHTINMQHLPPNFSAKNSTARLGDLVPLEIIKELHIRNVLGATRSLESAAKILDIDYATLWRYRKRYGA